MGAVEKARWGFSVGIVASSSLLLRGCEFDPYHGLIERVTRRSAESRGFNFSGYFSFLSQEVLTGVVLGSVLCVSESRWHSNQFVELKIC